MKNGFQVTVLDLEALKAGIWTEYSYDLVFGPIRFSVAQGQSLESQDSRRDQNQAIYTVLDHQDIIASIELII